MFAVALYKATLLGVFDLCCVMRGMNQFFMDVMLDEKVTETLIRKAFEFNFNVYESLLPGREGYYFHVNFSVPLNHIDFLREWLSYNFNFDEIIMNIPKIDISYDMMFNFKALYNFGRRRWKKLNFKIPIYFQDSAEVPRYHPKFRRPSFVVRKKEDYITYLPPDEE